MAIETQNGDYDLYASAATIFSKTAAADHDLSLEIRFGDGTKNMNAGVGTITITVTNDGGVEGGDSQVVYKGVQTRTVIRTGKLRVASGKTITITALSSNSNDTDVDVTVTPRWEVIADTNGKVAVPDTQKVDVQTIKTQTVTCAAGVTIHPAVGSDYKLGVDSDGYISSASDVDAQMLEEAIRQGYREGIDVIIPYAATPADRGTALLAAYATAKSRTPYGTAISATNRVNVYLPPWWYALAATLDLDTSYVNLIALYPEMGGHRQPTDVDYSNGTTSLDSFRPPRTVVFSITNGVTVIEQSAQSIRLDGFAVAQLSGYGYGAYHAYYVSGDDNEGSVYDRMYFWHKAPNTYRHPISFAKHVKGSWHKNIANSYAWRVGYDAALEGQFSVAMEECECGAFSIIGDYEIGFEGSHKATKCYVENVKAVGTFETTDVSLSGYGAFAGCDSFGCDIDSTCYFVRCEMGPQSAGIGAKNEGKWYWCRGGNYCQGSTVSNSYAGEFAGIDIGGIWGKGSLGGTKGGITSPGKLSGTCRNSTVLGSELPIRLQGATVDGCLFTMGTTNQDGVTLLDSNSKITNSTLLVVQGGTGIPINAASALNVCAVGNSYNNLGAAGQTNGLGANVSNVGNEAKTTTTADKSATATAAAAAILATPANKLVTDAAGAVISNLLFESTVNAYTPENPLGVTTLDIANGPNQDNVFLRATVVVYDASNSNLPSFRQVSASSFNVDETSLAVSGDFDFVPIAGDIVRIFLAPKEVDLIPIFDAAKTAASSTALAAVQTHGDSYWATGESAGTGARTVAVTVNDGTTALQSARVRFTKGAETYVGSTSASGIITFSLDDGTWSVAISLAGYTFTPTTRVVDGDETQTYSMTLVTVSPSDPGFITGYWQCYDEEGVAEAGQTVQMRMKVCSGYGMMYDSKIRSEDSDANGLATFINLDPGMTYQVRRGESGKWIDVTIPSTATSPYALQSIVGSDE